jgi:hypothetical protein
VAPSGPPPPFPTPPPEAVGTGPEGLVGDWVEVEEIEEED